MADTQVEAVAKAVVVDNPTTEDVATVVVTVKTIDYNMLELLALRQPFTASSKPILAWICPSHEHCQIHRKMLQATRKHEHTLSGFSRGRHQHIPIFGTMAGRLDGTHAPVTA